MSTSEPSSFLLFIGFLVDNFQFFSCNPWLIELSTPMSKRYSVRVHLLNPLPVPIFHFFFLSMATESAQPFVKNGIFFELFWTSQMYKAGIPPIHNNIHHFRQRVRTRQLQKTWICKWSGVWIGPDCGTKSKQKNIFLILFILEIVKIRRSLYAHFNFTNLRINTDILSPMQIIYSANFVCCLHHLLMPAQPFS